MYIQKLLCIYKNYYVYSKTIMYIQKLLCIYKNDMDFLSILLSGKVAGFPL